MKFNIVKGSEALPFNCINVDDGHRRSAKAEPKE